MGGTVVVVVCCVYCVFVRCIHIRLVYGVASCTTILTVGLYYVVEETERVE